MGREIRVFIASLTFAAGCGLTLNATPPRDDAAIGQGIDAGTRADAAQRDAGQRLVDGAPADDAFEEAPPDASNDARVRVDAALDATRLDAPLSPDAFVPDPCIGLPRGAVCASDPRRICLDGVCVPSFCGDAFLDPVEGEQCDPVAPSADPSCVDCRYECAGDSDCASMPPCLLASCESHRCVYTTPPGTCTTDAGTAGRCELGVCVRSTCGDRVRDPTTEECDVGPLSTPDCIACQNACDAADACDDGDACNGVERCAPGPPPMGGGVPGRLCVPGVGSLICDPPTTCHRTECVTNATGTAVCVETLIDGDGDGFAMDPACGAVGGDCADMDPTVHPGAIEVCNVADDDCDMAVDEETASVIWCPDDDGDGYGDLSRGYSDCGPRALTDVRDCSDCFDSATDRGVAALVHPGQRSFFTTPYCRGPGACSYDYDCNTRAELEVDDTVRCAGLIELDCNRTEGWSGTVPACGVEGTYADCRGITVFLCHAETSTRRQGCR